MGKKLYAGEEAVFRKIRRQNKKFNEIFREGKKVEEDYINGKYCVKLVGRKIKVVKE